MSADSTMLLIRNCDVFAQISEQEYEELNLIHHFKETEKGGYIYFEPSLQNKLYFLKDGYIKLGYVDDSGNEVIREIIQPGEVFGQITLEKSNDLNEFAQAYRSKVSLCAFNVEDFRRILEQNPGIAFQFNKQVGARLRRLESRLLNLLNKDVRARLIGFFYYLVQTNPEGITGNRFTLNNFLTHEDIARLIGSSRQTVTTFINDLEKEDLLVFDRQQIDIPDVKKLQKLASVG